MERKIGKIKAVVKDNDNQLRTIEFESGKVDTVDTVKADDINKNVKLTEIMDVKDFIPEEHKGQYVILKNCNPEEVWNEEVKRTTVIEEIVRQISECYLGVPDYKKRYVETQLDVALNGTNKIIWTANKNGYITCYLRAIFVEANQEIYNAQIKVNDEIVFQRREQVGRTQYELYETIPIKKDDIVELIPSGNTEPAHAGRGRIWYVPPISIYKTKMDLDYEELHTFNFIFKYRGNNLFSLNKWKVYNDVNFFGTVTFNANLISNLSGGFAITIQDSNGHFAESTEKTISFPNDLYATHLFVNNTEIMTVAHGNYVYSIGTHLYTIDIEFYKKTADPIITADIKIRKEL